MTMTSYTRGTVALVVAVLLGACSSVPDDGTDAACTKVNDTLSGADDTTSVAEVTAGLDSAGVIAAGIEDGKLMTAIADLSVAIEYGDEPAALDAAARVDQLCED